MYFKGIFLFETLQIRSQTLLGIRVGKRFQFRRRRTTKCLFQLTTALSHTTRGDYRLNDGLNARIASFNICQTTPLRGQQNAFVMQYSLNLRSLLILTRTFNYALLFWTAVVRTSLEALLFFGTISWRCSCFCSLDALTVSSYQLRTSFGWLRFVLVLMFYRHVVYRHVVSDVVAVCIAKMK